MQRSVESATHTEDATADPPNLHAPERTMPKAPRTDTLTADVGGVLHLGLPGLKTAKGMSVDSINVVVASCLASCDKRTWRPKDEVLGRSERMQVSASHTVVSAAVPNTLAIGDRYSTDAEAPTTVTDTAPVTGVLKKTAVVTMTKSVVMDVIAVPT